jgi:hypothetical protein
VELRGFKGLFWPGLHIVFPDFAVRSGKAVEGIDDVDSLRPVEKIAGSNE